MLLFLVSIVLYVFDHSKSDEDILQEVKSGLQTDFEACLRYYQLDSVRRQGVPKPACVACELTYSELGKLESWSNNEYLPVQKQINTLKVLDPNPVLEFDDRIYYQVRDPQGPRTYVTLIPISIEDKINNEFLLPFVFFGRWQQHLNKQTSWYTPNLFSIDEIRALKVSLSPDASGIEISDSSKRPIFTISNISIDAFRFQTRAAVILFFLLGLLIICIYLRIYALHHWDSRYYINLTLLSSIILFRCALWFTNLPGEYINVELFSPTVLAFQEIIAPSLGDLTINIFTLAIVVWILYTHFFRLINIVYRRILNHPKWTWVVSGLTIVISCLLFKVYLNFFESVITNSQVDIAFSNIFKASIYSFIILLDIGVLLLSFALIIISLLRFNILFGLRLQYNSWYIGFHIGILLITNLCLFLEFPEGLFSDLSSSTLKEHLQVLNSGWMMSILVSSCLTLLYLIVFRQPFRQILKFDLVNYVLLILSFSIMVTYSIIEGVQIKNKVKVSRIANRVLGGQTGTTVFNYETAMSNINGNKDEIERRYQELKDNSALWQFADWIKEQYFSTNFNQYEVSVYLFDQKNIRRDRTPGKPEFGPGSELSLQDRHSSVVNQSKTLHKLTNPDSRYLDLYIGVINKILKGDSLLFIIKLAPVRLETEGLYPSLSMEKELYEDIKLINSFDHALYQDGILYSTGGDSPFPIYLAEEKKYKTNYKHEIIGEDGERYTEYIQSIDDNKVVVVRHLSQDFFQIITTFSFVFYFFSLASLVLVILPAIGLRNLRVRTKTQNLPLRTKIRLGLLAISILPMIVIIIFLTPFISDRYEEEAKLELSAETERIANALSPDYKLTHNDALSRMSLNRQFQERVRQLSEVVRNDINVYNDLGRRIASTQPTIYKSGLTTDLMNSRAYNALKEGRLSELVIDEKVGRLSYFSGYRPIIANSTKPIGYVNVPYIARQDQLDERVLNFLAYLANIYLLVFLLLNFVAVLVSNTITQPLSLIQQRLSATGLGNANKPINYDSKDEIGAIVTAYNQMVEKLSESERKLSQTHRELAWRQMARQVAHEIKNPLTPMRLSIQHLERAWKVKSNSLDKMFPRVMKTLMVQIDSLVRIANSFHEFAKMPDPVKDKIVVNDVLLEVVDLYAQSEEATWLIDIPQEKFHAFSDRDQLSRCFNNIIKNALQAIDENGTIHISMTIENQHAFINIKDNGKGMNEDVQKKVFEPNFSTKNSGMGLGLAIVRRIIESSGGSIDFESKLNRGTTFKIVLPSVEIA